MAETTSAKIYGLKEMEEALKAMSSQLGGKEGRPVNAALNAARRSVLARAKANAPISKNGSNIDWHKSKNGKWVHGGPNGQKAAPGRLRRAIVNMEERRPEHYSVVKYVGVRKGKTRNDENGAWYAPIIEFRGGANGEGKGFMQRSISPEADGRVYAKSLASGVERLAKKIGDENTRQLAAQVRKAHTIKKPKA